MHGHVHLRTVADRKSRNSVSCYIKVRYQGLEYIAAVRHFVRLSPPALQEDLASSNNEAPHAMLRLAPTDTYQYKVSTNG